MNELLEAPLDFVRHVPTERVEAVARRFQGIPGGAEPTDLEGLLTSSKAKAYLDELVRTWKTTGLSGDFLSGLLVGAAASREEVLSESVVRFVWTGPTTPLVPTRRTDQVLLELVRQAERELFFVSFVTYHVPSLVEALNEASGRGVEVSFLLESPKSLGGTLEENLIERMRERVPKAKFYVWRTRPEPFVGGRVHAKIALADDRIAFVGSANLTEHAVSKNMEAGILLSGGPIPQEIHEHLHALVDLDIIEEWTGS